MFKLFGRARMKDMALVAIELLTQYAASRLVSNVMESHARTPHTFGWFHRCPVLTYVVPGQ